MREKEGKYRGGKEEVRIEINEGNRERGRE